MGKKTRVLSVAGALLGLFMQDNGGYVYAKEDDPVIIKFKDGTTKRLSDAKALKAAEPQLKDAPFEMVFTAIRSKMLAENLMDRAASKDKSLDNDPEVKRVQKLCLNAAKREVFMQNNIKSGLTDKNIRAHYATFAKGFAAQEAVELKHILVNGKEEAAKIIGQINNGASFENLAKEKSLDAQTKNGGTLGLLTKNELSPTFAEVAFSLKKNEVASVPVQSDFGWHVIKLIDKRPAKAPKFEDVKDDLRDAVAQQKAQEILQELFSSEQPEVFEIDGTPAVQTIPGAKK